MVTIVCDTCNEEFNITLRERAKVRILRCKTCREDRIRISKKIHAQGQREKKNRKKTSILFREKILSGDYDVITMIQELIDEQANHIKKTEENPTMLYTDYSYVKPLVKKERRVWSKAEIEQLIDNKLKNQQG